MKTIVDEYFEFYEIFKEKYSKILKSENIGILSKFLDNKNNIIEFHKKYVQPNTPKIVICGINPGRYGAGKTGIPFIDFKSLSKIFPDIANYESEKSAKFFFEIIEDFGINKFYKSFHVTNISWYGFQHKENNIIGNNINYYDLPFEIQNFLFDKFIEEMNFIKPDTIIPLGTKVYWELLRLKAENKLKAKIDTPLQHPTYCRVDKDIYMKTLTRYLN